MRGKRAYATYLCSSVSCSMSPIFCAIVCKVFL
jgi:hypothetical protein